MAGRSISLTARLKSLEAAKARAATLKRGTKLSSMPMAKLVGVGWPTLRGWCEEVGEVAASGAMVGGGNGIEYEFDPRRTIKILLSHFRTRIEAQAKKSRAITKAIGVDMSPAETATSFAETKQLVELTLAVTGAAEKQGRYVLADEMVSFIEGYNRVVVDGIMGVRTKADPNGNLPPSVRKLVDEFLRSLAVTVSGRAGAFIEVHRASIGQAGAS